LNLRLTLVPLQEAALMFYLFAATLPSGEDIERSTPSDDGTCTGLQ
jgi:hypothetical protein